MYGGRTAALPGALQHTDGCSIIGKARDRAVETLHVRSLGPFAFRSTSAWSSGPAFKRGRELLEYLTAYAERAVARETLVETLWPDAEGPSAVHRLHVAVSGARTALRAVVSCADPIGSS